MPTAGRWMFDIGAHCRKQPVCFGKPESAPRGEVNETVSENKLVVKDGSCGYWLEADGQNGEYSQKNSFFIKKRDIYTEERLWK